MVLEEKIEIIKQNKEPAISALNSIIDRIQMLTDNYDETRDKSNIGEFLSNITADIPKYEYIKSKIIKEDFDNFTLLDVNQVALAFTFAQMSFKSQIERYQKANDLVSDVIEKLQSKN